MGTLSLKAKGIKLQKLFYQKAEPNLPIRKVRMWQGPWNTRGPPCSQDDFILVLFIILASGYKNMNVSFLSCSVLLPFLHNIQISQIMWCVCHSLLPFLLDTNKQVKSALRSAPIAFVASAPTYGAVCFGCPEIKSRLVDLSCFPTPSLSPTLINKWLNE